MPTPICSFDCVRNYFIFPSFFFFFTFRHKTSFNQKFAQAHWEPDDSLLVERPLSAAFHGGDSEDHDSSNEGKHTLLTLSLNWSEWMNTFDQITESTMWHELVLIKQSQEMNGIVNPFNATYSIHSVSSLLGTHSVIQQSCSKSSLREVLKLFSRGADLP